MSVRAPCALVMAGIVAVGISACGSGEGSDTAPEPSVDLSQLDVGNYPTQPRQIGTVKNPEQARLIEAERLGNFVPAPSDIDPKYVHNSPSIATVFIDPEAALGKIMNVDRFAEAAPDFVGGFVSAAGSAPNNQGIDLLNAVMIFPDERKAADAAAALERVDFEYSDQNQPIQIPKYPAARAHWQPREQSIGSWYATGKLVIYTWVYDYLKIYLEKVDQPALLALVENSLDTVVPAVSKFAPTPPNMLMSAQIDDEGMLGRALPRPREDSWLNPPGVYTGHTAQHFSSDPADLRKTVEENGVDKFATDGTDIYRARDAGAAKQVREDLGGLTKQFKGSAAPKNLPQARCKEYIGRQSLAIRFYCSVTYDRYAAFSWSHQLLDAQQRISAQYALLVNAE